MSKNNPPNDASDKTPVESDNESEVREPGVSLKEPNAESKSRYSIFSEIRPAESVSEVDLRNEVEILVEKEDLKPSISNRTARDSAMSKKESVLFEDNSDIESSESAEPPETPDTMGRPSRTISEIKSKYSMLSGNLDTVREETTSAERRENDDGQYHSSGRSKKYVKHRTTPADESSSSASLAETHEATTTPGKPARTLVIAQPPSDSWHRRESTASSGRPPSRRDPSLPTNLAIGKVFVYVVVPPDGGFGWFITFISFLCQVIVDGLVFSIGILMPYIAADIGVSQSQIVMLVSIQIGCYFLSGPISSACINLYGFRPVAMAGAAMSSVAIMTTTYCHSLGWMIFFYSIIAGPTLSMIWVSSQLIIGYYFEKYRPIANGLSCSGAGVGILIASAFNSAVVDEIGWRNTLRCHALILTTILVMSLSYVEVAPTRVGHMFEENFDSDSETSGEVLRTVRYSTRSTLHTQRQSVTVRTSLHQMVADYDPDKTQKPSFWTYWCCCCCCCKCGKRRRTSAVRIGSMAERRVVVRNDLIERQDMYYTGPKQADYVNRRATVIDGRTIQLNNAARQADYTLAMMQPARVGEQRHRSVYKSRQARVTCCQRMAPSYWLPPKVTSAFKLLFDLRLLGMAEFQILLAAAFFFPMGFNIPFVYSTVRAEVPEEFANLISPAIGLSNFVCRIASGFVAYQYQNTTTYVCGGGLIFGGVTVFISAFYGADLVWFQFMYAIFYGVAPAFYSTLRAIIYVRALGLEKLTNAFGLTAMSMGLGVFIGTSLAGFLNEYTGDYTASFAFGGCCMIIAGLLKVLIVPFLEWRMSVNAKSRRVTFLG